MILLSTLFAMGAINIETGKAMQIPTPKAFTHLFKKPFVHPVFTQVNISDIKNPIAKAIIAANKNGLHFLSNFL